MKNVTLGNIVVVSPNFYPINPGLCAISVIEKRQQSVHMPRNFHRSFSLDGKTRKNSVAFWYTVHGRVQVSRNQKVGKGCTLYRKLLLRCFNSTNCIETRRYGSDMYYEGATKVSRQSIWLFWKYKHFCEDYSISHKMFTSGF